MVRIVWTFEDSSSLRRATEEELLEGRAFVPGASCPGDRAPCELVLIHAERTHTLVGEVVFAREGQPGAGVGIALARLDPSGKASLRAFVEAAESAAPAGEATDAPPTGDALPADDDATDDDAAREASPMHERIRRLSSTEQQKLAAAGTLSERTALERMFGPNVWETLLKNPRLTAPEVARIARKGTVPRPLLDLIGSNGAWLAVGEIQRAMLANPRTAASIVAKILASMPKHELLRVPQQTAYPASVRAAAKRLLGG